MIEKRNNVYVIILNWVCGATIPRGQKMPRFLNMLTPGDRWLQYLLYWIRRPSSPPAPSARLHSCKPCHHVFTSWSTILPEREVLPCFYQETTGKKISDRRCDSYWRNPATIMEQSCRCQDCAFLVRRFCPTKSQSLNFLGPQSWRYAYETAP